MTTTAPSSRTGSDVGVRSKENKNNNDDENDENHIPLNSCYNSARSSTAIAVRSVLFAASVTTAVVLLVSSASIVGSIASPVAAFSSPYHRQYHLVRRHRRALRRRTGNSVDDDLVSPLFREPRRPRRGGTMMINTATSGTSETTNDALIAPTTTTTGPTLVRASLIGPFAIRVEQRGDDDDDDGDDDERERFFESWSLRRVRCDDENDGATKVGVGASALRALREAAATNDDDDDDDDADAFRVAAFVARVDGRSDVVAVRLVTERLTEAEDDDEDEDEESRSTLRTVRRCLAQRAVARAVETARAAGAERATATVRRDDDDGGVVEIVVPTATDAVSSERRRRAVRELLRDDDDVVDDAELVNVVDANGAPLAVLPRPIAHARNALHAGVGVLVRRDRPRDDDDAGDASSTAIYVHRRTDTKRVFPSLYDMFVGGVSAFDEDPTTTAGRELSEELGLRNPSALRGPLFRCTICTSYNRCVVTMFDYAANTDAETIEWQEEEVSWGQFVSHDVVREAARLSVGRLKATNEWPGTYDDDENDVGDASATIDDVAADDDEWRTWDFVPDGLLVWEAWNEWWKEGAHGEI